MRYILLVLFVAGTAQAKCVGFPKFLYNDHVTFDTEPLQEFVFFQCEPVGTVFNLSCQQNDRVYTVIFKCGFSDRYYDFKESELRREQ